MRNGTENRIVAALDSRWTLHPDGGVAGETIVQILDEAAFTFGHAPSPASLYGASITRALEIVEAEGGLQDRILVLRFPAARGSAFAKLITRPHDYPDHVANSGWPSLWPKLRAMHRAGRLQLAWRGPLAPDLEAVFQHFARQAAAFPHKPGRLLAPPTNPYVPGVDLSGVQQ